MSAYGFMVTVCIGGPIAAGIYFSVESIRLKTVLLLGFLLTGGVILHYAPVVASKLHPLFESTASNEVLGSLDATQAGSRISTPESGKVVKVGQGEVLTLMGWMETSLGDGAPPSIVLESTNKKTPQVLLKVTATSRPDVVKYFSNPMLEHCGFQAQIRIPDSQPVGIYQILMRRDSPGNRRHYYPKDKIEIITSADAAALQKAEEMKLHPPSPSPTITQASQPKKKKTKPPR